MAARRSRPGAWPRTGWASPGPRLPTGMPPPMRPWPRTSRRANRSSAGRMRDYLEARTRFFDRVVVGAIGRGVRQIVLGAAGYDGRAFRYARPGVHWYEVDHPATQQDKQERLARLGLAAGQVQFVAADFARDPVADRLTAAGLDPGRPSLFLLEGVAVYLEPAVLERVLGQFRHVARAGSRLAISVSAARPGSETRSRFQATVAAWASRPGPRSTPAQAPSSWPVPAGGSGPATTLTMPRPPPGATGAVRPACSPPSRTRPRGHRPGRQRRPRRPARPIPEISAAPAASAVPLPVRPAVPDPGRAHHRARQ